MEAPPHPGPEAFVAGGADVSRVASSGDTSGSMRRRAGAVLDPEAAGELISPVYARIF